MFGRNRIAVALSPFLEHETTYLSAALVAAGPNQLRGWWLTPSANLSLRVWQSSSSRRRYSPLARARHGG